MAKWSLLTNHARLLLAIEREPGLRVRDLADRVGLTERAIHFLLRDLRREGYVDARRHGRRVSYSVIGDKPVRDSSLGHRTVGQRLRFFLEPPAPVSDARPQPGQSLYAYYVRLRVAEAAEAVNLAEALVQQGTLILEEADSIISLLRPASDTDDLDEWDEQTFAALILFLQEWSGANPRRELTILEERPVELAKPGLRRAS